MLSEADAKGIKPLSVVTERFNELRKSGYAEPLTIVSLKPYFGWRQSPMAAIPIRPESV